MAQPPDQGDLDALLSAVDAVEAAVPAGGERRGRGATGVAAARPVYSHRLTHGGSGDDAEIRDYDFKRPERVSKDQMRALETLHEAFARNFGAALSGFLRTIIEVKVANIEQMTFSEFTHSLPSPTCFNLLGCEPLEGAMCLELSPLIVFPVIDRLLGGSSGELFIPQRPLTAIELRLVSKILDRAMAALHEAWESVQAVEFRLRETESNPALVQIVPPNEVVVVVGFELKMGGRAGTMSLCIPYNVIEPVVERLSNQTWAAYKRKGGDQRLKGRLAGRLEAAKLKVAAELATTTISVGDLRHLQVGDVVLTDKPATAPLSLHVGGRAKFIGQLGQYRGNRAFKVSRPILAKDRV